MTVTIWKVCLSPGRTGGLWGSRARWGRLSLSENTDPWQSVHLPSPLPQAQPQALAETFPRSQCWRVSWEEGEPRAQRYPSRSNFSLVLCRPNVNAGGRHPPPPEPATDPGPSCRGCWECGHVGPRLVMQRDLR